MSLSGLTDQEVKERISSGKVNVYKTTVSRGYLDIIIKNVCSVFNLILFILGAALLVCHEYTSALSATGIIVINILISTIQEMRAKRRLDKIALLLKPVVKIIRNGEEIETDPSKIVMDDIIHLTAGDQAQVDGELIEGKSFEMDESLLTGESSSRRKHVGDTIFSGAFCITGDGYYRVTKLGQDTFASEMTSAAKKYKKKKTPLQMETYTITEFLMIAAFIFLGINVLIGCFDHETEVTLLKEAAIILDIVPIALFLLITLTYMIAAVRMADSGVLLQNSNSVEAMSHVDTVCMDKTGTITTNNLIFEDLRSFTDDAEDVVKTMISCTGSRNHTINALEARFPVELNEPQEEIQFTSDRKYSAVRANGMTVFMGALTSLGGHIKTDLDLEGMISEESKKGLRTILICKGPDTSLYIDEEPCIPDLEPVCIITIRDEVREDCKEIIDSFIKGGMDIKVISGDNPETVDSLFSLANIPGERKILSGDEFDSIPKEEFAQKILETNIFGRMKPDQKELVIKTLKENGRDVAMVGDGVNDVRSLKAADVGIALQSGSGAARGVADMVLVDDRFDALPKSIIEGKRTVSGMRDILRLYLTRNFVLMFLVFIMLLIFGEVPLLPEQNAYYALISVSFAAFMMIIWAKPSDKKGLVLPDVLGFCVPIAILISVFGLAVYAFFWFGTTDGFLNIPYDGMFNAVKDTMNWTDVQEMIDYLGTGGTGDVAEINARNGMLMFLVIAGISQLFLICPLAKFYSVNGEVSKDWKPTIFAFLLFGLIILLYNVPQVAVLIGRLAIFPLECYLYIIPIFFVWFVITILVLRSSCFKFLNNFVQGIFDRKLVKAMRKEKEKEDQGR